MADWDEVERLRQLYWAPGGPYVSMGSIFRAIGIEPPMMTEFMGRLFEGPVARHAIEMIQTGEAADRFLRERTKE